MKHILLRPAFLIVLFVSVYSTQAQKVTGFVTAFKSYPLENAKVKSLKTEKSTFTDSSGRFSLETIPGDVILISAEGFFDRKIKTEKSLDLNIDLRYKFDETSFDEAVKNNHISAVALREALKTFHSKGQKDYSKYQNVFGLIRAEISNVRVSGTNVYSIKAISFSMSPQVLYVVNDMVVNDISYISPSEITKIVYLEDNEASDYGIRGANGVLKITLRTR